VLTTGTVEKDTIQGTTMVMATIEEGMMLLMAKTIGIIGQKGGK